MQWAQGMMQGGEQRVPPVLPRGHFSKLMAKQQPSVKERKRRQEKRSKKDKQQGLEARRQRPRSSRDKLVDHFKSSSGKLDIPVANSESGCRGSVLGLGQGSGQGCRRQ